MTDVATVARGLSEAQRRVISAFRPEWVCCWNIQAADAFERKGLGTRHSNTNCFALTDLGLAVRAHLLSGEGLTHGDGDCPASPVTGARAPSGSSPQAVSSEAAGHTIAERKT